VQFYLPGDYGTTGDYYLTYYLPPLGPSRTTGREAGYRRCKHLSS